MNQPSASSVLGRLSCMLLFLLCSGCVSFSGRWHEAHQQTFDGRSIAGIWAGPWQEGDNYNGHVKGVVAKTPDDEWEAIVRVTSQNAGLLKGSLDRHLYYWDFRVPLDVTPRPDGTYRITSQSRQWERLVGLFDLVIEGTADNDEILLGFSRGAKPGQMRLTRITPQPMVSVGLEPIISIRYDSQEVRDQVRAAARLPLIAAEPQTAPDGIVHASAEVMSE